jgi:hypothetical protein
MIKGITKAIVLDSHSIWSISSKKNNMMPNLNTPMVFSSQLPGLFSRSTLCSSGLEVDGERSPTLRSGNLPAFPLRGLCA